MAKSWINPLLAYDDLLVKILDRGLTSPSRAILPSTGLPVDTKCLFGEMIKIPLGRDSFPATTRKGLFFRGVLVELIWFLSGSTNIKFLNDNGVHIWDEWADEKGELGPVYGSQWVNWGKGDLEWTPKMKAAMANPDTCRTAHIKEVWEAVQEKKPINQIKQVLSGLVKDPNGRRHIINAWNVAEIPQMKLPPCHVMSQWRVLQGKLHCMMTQRSADVFLGVPFNIASYALLTHLFAELLHLEPGELTISFGDVHIYENHLDAVEEYLARGSMPAPQLDLGFTEDIQDIDDWQKADRWKQIKLSNYSHHGNIKAEIAV